LTRVITLCFGRAVNRVPRARDSRAPKEEPMLRTTLYARLALLVLVLAALAVVLGSEPWGPY